MSNTTGEMPFLDHLEELRGRIIRVLIAVIVGVGLGLWFVSSYPVLIWLKAPIAPFLPDGKLTVLTPTEPVMVVLKLGFVLGLVLASPVVIYQLWAFLSPALYEKEKKAMMPALFAGLLLFFLGAWLGWAYGVPLSVKFLLTFQADTFNNQITFDSYFSFVVQVILAIGFAFELPLVMTLITWLGVMDAKRWHAFRRYAVLLCFVAGAIISPGTDPFSMIICSVMLLLLYELGVLGAYVTQRKRKRAIAAGAAILLVFGLAGAPQRLEAQNPPTRPTPTDTSRRGAPGGVGTRTIDSSTAKRLGLPAKPKWSFPGPDSVMQALLKREGFAVTRFRGDSATLLPNDEGLLLGGRAATQRDTSVLEADRIRYSDARCELVANGSPRMFENGAGNGTILVGREMRFDTCLERGVIGEALTTFNDGTDWFLRGNLAVDSTGKRLYAARGEFTSCDLPEPHYHFRAGQIKWVSQSTLVARPAVLYIRDVPVVWMPFLFQDTKRGRRSGILVPNFGFNDIVRPTRSYNRQVTNVGYYWAPNDYIDVTGRFDWYANRYIQYGGALNYRWRDRFITGGITLNKMRQDDGSGGIDFSMVHSQRFNVTTSLSADIRYSSNTRVIQNNSVDPLQSTQQISSSLNLQKQFRWGNVTLGGTRRQQLSDGSGTMTLPTLTITPKGFEFGRHVTWSPNLSITNTTEFKLPLPSQFAAGSGLIDTLAVLGRSRLTSVNLGTPIRIRGFTWNNAFAYTDQVRIARAVGTEKIPNEATPDPNDSLLISSIRGGTFSSGLNWETSIALPTVLTQTLKVTPTVGIANITSGNFLIRNERTNGDWVQQGKKFQFGLTSAPQFYGFINKGVGPFTRFRHYIQPTLNMQYSPAATLSEEYARAISSANNPVKRETPATLTASLTLNQELSGKLRPAQGDTTTDQRNWRKMQILQLNTSAIAYDFEQAKLPGRTGWTTQSVTNTMQSELIRGFTFTLTHDLWAGQAGIDTSRFSPFLSNVQANMSLTGGTFRSLLALVGLAKHGDGRPDTANVRRTPIYTPANRRFRPGAFGNSDPFSSMGGGGFNAQVSFSLARQRPGAATTITDPITGQPVVVPNTSPNRTNISFNTSFAPTQAWRVSWQTQYNVTDGRFESQLIQLQRDLHDWQASFNFSKSATGNYGLFFMVSLKPLPDVKFDYNQTTLNQSAIRP